MTFKQQHPKDLISRLYILEYMREIGANKLYEKSNDLQKSQYFYKFINEDNNAPIQEVDINWEYCLFVATMPQLEYFMKNFLEEIEEIESKRKKIMSQPMTSEESVASINLRDIAVADVQRTKAEMEANGYRIH